MYSTSFTRSSTLIEYVVYTMLWRAACSFMNHELCLCGPHMWSIESCGIYGRFSHANSYSISKRTMPMNNMSEVHEKRMRFQVVLCPDIGKGATPYQYTHAHTCCLFWEMKQCKFLIKTYVLYFFIKLILSNFYTPNDGQ